VPSAPGVSNNLNLELLYARYRRLVVAYLRGQGAVDPEDLASEVFVGVVRGLPRFVGNEEAFRSWLFVIAHRRFVDERRDRGRRPTMTVEPERLVELGAAEIGGDVEHEALQGLSTERMLDLLGDLTDDQRTVVLLHTIAGLSLSRIAGMLSKHIEAVKGLHHRGLAKAARAFADSAEWSPVVLEGRR
jgi:RNA polymerase sigma factor (sigma-70 family)